MEGLSSLKYRILFSYAKLKLTKVKLLQLQQRWNWLKLHDSYYLKSRGKGEKYFVTARLLLLSEKTICSLEYGLLSIYLWLM